MRRLGFIALGILVGCNAALGLSDYQDADGSGGASNASSVSASSSGGASTATGGGGGAATGPTTTGSGGGGGDGVNVTATVGLTIAANSELPAGYSIAVDLDHADLIANGYATADRSGDDIRVYQGDTEIDRYREPATDWETASTRIWFSTQSVIAGAGVDISYRVVIGEGPNEPLHDHRNVFEFFDDFDASTLDAGWMAVPIGNNASGTANSNLGNLAAVCTSSGTFASTNDSFYFVHRAAVGSVFVESLVRNTSNSSVTSALLGGVMVRTTAEVGVKYGAVTISEAGLGAFYTRNGFNAPTITTGQSSAQLPYFAQIKVSGSQVVGSWALDGVSWSALGTETISGLDSSRVGIPVAANSMAEAATANVDWFRIRKAVANEPVVTVSGASPSQP